MKIELFLMRTLFALVAIATVTAMGGMIGSSQPEASGPLAHQAVTPTTAG